MTGSHTHRYSKGETQTELTAGSHPLLDTGRSSADLHLGTVEDKVRLMEDSKRADHSERLYKDKLPRS